MQPAARPWEILWQEPYSQEVHQDSVKHGEKILMLSGSLEGKVPKFQVVLLLSKGRASWHLVQAGHLTPFGERHKAMSLEKGVVIFTAFQANYLPHLGRYFNLQLKHLFSGDFSAKVSCSMRVELVLSSTCADLFLPLCVQVKA